MYDVAISYFQKGLEINPKSVDILIELSNTQFDDKKTEEAI